MTEPTKQDQLFFTLKILNAQNECDVLDKDGKVVAFFHVTEQQALCLTYVDGHRFETTRVEFNSAKKLIPLGDNDDCIVAQSIRQDFTVWAEFSIPATHEDPCIVNWRFFSQDPDCTIKIIIKTQ